MNIKIYQLYYNDSCKSELLDGMIHRKNVNPSPDSLYRENLDIIDIFYNENWQTADYIGVLSWKFHEKTGLTYQDIVDQVKQKPCYVLSPKKMNDYGHTFSEKAPKDIHAICDYFDSKENENYKLKNYPVDKTFCNYWLLTPELFRSYCLFLLKYMAWFEYSKSTDKFKQMEFKLPNQTKCKTICLFFEGLFGVWLKENKIDYEYIQDHAPQKSELTQLAIKYKTDKWGSHYYTEIYHKYFKHLQNESMKIFEIGVGGYANSNIGGESLRMWKDYFKKGEIYAIDIENKKHFSEDRIKIYQGDQTNENIMNSIGIDAEKFDIIIDDGSHLNPHQIKSFEIMFKWLKPDGIYVIEDSQTSYWPDHQNGFSAMEYFKKRSDNLNYREFLIPNYQPDYFDQNIQSIHFYHNLIFIFKGENTELSNVVNNGIK